MFGNEITIIAQYLGVPSLVIVCSLFILLAWSLFWKGWALWVAARQSQKIWFVAFLLVNTLGIIEIIYLFLLNKRGDDAA